MLRLRGGAVGGDDLAEADAEIPGNRRHAEGADGEVVFVGEDFDGDFLGKIDAVFLTEGAAGLFQQFQDGFAVDFGFVGVHPHDEVLVLQRAELIEAVAQFDEVERRDFVAVVAVDRFGKLPAFVFFTETQQVLAELNAGRQVVGLKREGPPLVRCAFGETSATACGR